jgi:hypothetical protein
VTGKRRKGYLLYKDIYRSATGMSRSTNIILPNSTVYPYTLLREYNISLASILFLFPFVKDLCTVGIMIFIDLRRVWERGILPIYRYIQRWCHWTGYVYKYHSTNSTLNH